MKLNLILIAVLALAFNTSYSQKITQVDKPLAYVSTLVGTQSTYFLSSGNTYPAIARPWGMNFWSPQTGKMGDGCMYTYTA